MPEHSWTCISCGNKNPPYTEVCRDCALFPNGVKPATFLYQAANQIAAEASTLSQPIFQDSFSFQRAFRALPRFLWLLLWELPLRKEENLKRRFDMGFSYLALLLPLIVYFTQYAPYIMPGNFPALSELPVLEGTLVKHPLKKNTRYGTAPIGIQTADGDIFKRCSGLGVSCYFGTDDRKNWADSAGLYARIWYLDDWVVQIEVEGDISRGISYERGRDRFTGFLHHFWMLILITGYIAFRLGQRYFIPAVRQAYEKH